MKLKLKLYGAAIFMLMLTATGLAQFGAYIGEQVPFDRLVKNTEDYIKEHPKDEMGPYTLARIHYFALAFRVGITGMPYRAKEDKEHPPAINESMWFLAPHGPHREIKPTENEWTNDQLREHLKAAVTNYQKAIQMAFTIAAKRRNLGEYDNEGLFHLGLACVSEAALSLGFKLGPIPGGAASAPPKDGDYAPLWREQAIAEYLKAFELNVGVDTSFPHAPMEGIYSFVSYEAGEAYVAMVRARGPSDAELETIKRIEISLKTLREKPIHAVTPIVFRLTEAAPLADLLDATKTVAFDLDGSGLQQRYTWLRPDTGILVWDPLNEGKITSGNQLFGSVSFHMFWSDGYRALDALDDNRDGELRGEELAGLAVWFDRNQNGVSDAGEVVPIERTGIAAISARATFSIGASLANEAGLVMTDGRVLPSYDWTTKQLKDAPATPHATPRS